MRARIQIVGVALLAVTTAALVALALTRPAWQPASVSGGNPAGVPVAAMGATPSPSPAQASSPAPSAKPTPTAHPASDVRFAAVGDGITLADSPDFSRARVGALSWLTYAKAPRVVFSGGWAVAGATTANLAEDAAPMDVDALVILAGSNDVSRGVPFAQTAANLTQIVATVGAKRVIVSAIPPRDAAPQPTADFNTALMRLASQQKWTFVDAPAGVRDGSVYAAGMSDDGVQPSRAAAQVIGTAIGRALAPSQP